MGLLAHFEEILNEYDGLTLEDIRACLLFATKSLESTEFTPLGSKTIQVRFLVDECTGPAVARCLRDRGHDVVSV